MKNILIVDDHEGARATIRGVLCKAYDTPAIQDVGTLAQARLLLENDHFDLVVLDLSLPDGAGERFIPDLLDRQPEAYVVISTIHDESNRLMEALEAGAKGYLLKEQSEADLVEHFRSILSGRPPLAPAVTRKVLETLRSRSENRTTPNGAGQPSPAVQEEILLTPREVEVLKLLAKGFSRPEVAGFLDISKNTVATHIGNIYEKLQISSRSEATLYAAQNGLL